MTHKRYLPLLLLIGLWGCSSVDPATRLTRELLSTPKEEAYAKGDALVARRKYEQGRQYLRFVAENYANDPIGKQAALRLADSYFEERSVVGYAEAEARFRDFRSRYPSHPKADYALYRLAQCADRQAEAPDRDQTNTRQASSAYRELLQSYPGSPYESEARIRMKAMRDLLAEHEYRVGYFYYRRKAYVAAKQRFDTLLAAFPDFSSLEKVLFFAGWVEKRLGNAADAALLFEKLRTDYPSSQLLRKIPPDLSATPPVSTAGAVSGPT